MRVFLALLFLFCLTGHNGTAAAPVAAPSGASAQGSAPAAATSRFVFRTFFKNKPITGLGDLTVPAGKGPFPVMIMLHGSRGIIPEQVAYYRGALVSRNIALLVIDSFGPRGVGHGAAQGDVSPATDMVMDAHMALQALAADSRMNTRRAGLFGFSKGGFATLMSALRVWPRKVLGGRPKERFSLYAAFYPGCAIQPHDLRAGRAPIYMFLGERDDYTGTENCKELALKLQVYGADIHTTVYPDAMHGWDTPESTENPQAEVLRNCLFEQQPDETWSERSTKIKMRSLNGPEYAKALSACRSFGARTQENGPAKAAALKELMDAVNTYLLAAHPPRPEPRKREKRP